MLNQKNNMLIEDSPEFNIFNNSPIAKNKPENVNQ